MSTRDVFCSRSCDSGAALSSSIFHSGASAVPSFLTCARAQDRLVGDEHVAHLLERLRERDHLERAAGVLEHEARHLVALLRDHLAVLADDAADRVLALRLARRPRSRSSSRVA